MARPLNLSVNVDHIATLRQARRATYPDPVDAAKIAEAAGASGITVHLRADRRHIQDGDVTNLRRVVQGKLNLEMSIQPEMLAVALDMRPDQVTLVPENPDEITTEGGLDLVAHRDAIESATETLVDAGLPVSLFLDPDAKQLSVLADLSPDLVSGFEINTDAYTRAEGRGKLIELNGIRRIADQGAQHGFRVYAGHGLTTDNVVDIAEIGQIEELNIGHWLVSRGALVGLGTAVEEMMAAMQTGRSRVP